MYGPEGNSWSCFPKSLNVSQDEVEGNIRTRGKTKLTCFPRDHTLIKALLYIFRLSLKQSYGKDMLLYSTHRQQLRNCIPVCENFNFKLEKPSINLTIVCKHSVYLKIGKFAFVRSQDNLNLTAKMSPLLETSPFFTYWESSSMKVSAALGCFPSSFFFLLIQNYQRNRFLT